MKRPIMIMAGGTGGHVFPALAVADYMDARDIPLLWLGTNKGIEARIVPEAGYQLLTLSIRGIRGKGILTKLIAPFKILLAVLQALKIMVDHKPAAVLGMGGFASGPGGLAAWLMRIPLFIHEQNAIAGMTNHYLSKLATQVFEAFPNTFTDRINAETVGNPVRDSIINLDKGSQFKQETRILIVGGSLGARSLNQVMPETIGKLVAVEGIGRVSVWHQTGKADLEKTQVAYNEKDLEVQVEAFLDDIDQAYAWADLVICRSGALTVSELAVAGLPSILVPYPYAVDDHQKINAKYLVDANAAVLIKDSELGVECLLPILCDWIQTPNHLKMMSKNAKSVAKIDATECVAESIMEVAYAN